MTALLSADEIDAIAPAHVADVITGTVTTARITLRASNQRYDIIHFVCHCSADGVRLSDGAMTPDEILRLARHTRAKLVFFNACRSTIPGQFLIDSDVPAAIVHNNEVLDREAIQLAAYFYAELIENGGDLRAAYKMVNRRDGSLSWLSDGNYRDPSVDVILGEISALKASGSARDRRLLWLAAFVGVDVVVSLIATLWFLVR